MHRSIEQAAPHEAELAMEVISLCKVHMRAHGSDQWNDLYPQLETVQADANAGSLYLLRDGDVCVGAICLNEVQAPEYAALPWRHDPARILVVHRLCVRPDYQGHGAARMLMDFAEVLAQKEGYGAIRLDTYTGNPRAIDLYVKRGYEIAGKTELSARRLPVVCFEKRIDA